MLRRTVTHASTGSPPLITTMPSAFTIATAAGAVRGSPTARPSALAPGTERQRRASGALSLTLGRRPGRPLGAALRRLSGLFDAGAQRRHQVLNPGSRRRLDPGRPS